MSIGKLQDRGVNGLYEQENKMKYKKYYGIYQDQGKYNRKNNYISNIEQIDKKEIKQKPKKIQLKGKNNFSKKTKLTTTMNQRKLVSIPC